jgi:hypothetical protein
VSLPKGLFHFFLAELPIGGEMKRKLEILRILMLLATLFCISGCGVDGDDSGSPSPPTPPPAYTGITDPAPITANNAQALTTGALNGADTGIAFPVSDSSPDTTVSQEEAPISGYLLRTIFAFKKTGEKYNTSKAIKALSSTVQIVKPSAVIKKPALFLVTVGEKSPTP